MKNSHQYWLITLFFFSLFLLSTETIVSQNEEYIGIFSSGSGSNIFTPPKTWSQFETEGELRISQGMRLVDIETFKDGRRRKYIGVWRSGSGSNFVSPPKTWAQFEEEGALRISQGMRLVDIETFKEGRSRKYIGVWRSGSGSNFVSPPKTWAQFEEEGEQRISQGMRLVDIETFKEGRIRKYIGVWRSGSGSNFVSAPKTWAQFKEEGALRISQGMRLKDVEIFKEHNTQRYIGIWSRGNGSNILTPPKKRNPFIASGEEFMLSDMRLTDVEVFRANEIEAPSPGPPSGPDDFPHIEDLPRLPSYIKPVEDNTLVIDFTTPRPDDAPAIIHLPTHLLPLLPQYPEGETIFPTEFCGFRIIGAQEIKWLDRSGNEINLLPGTNIELNNLEDLYRNSDVHLGGIEISGPIGKCSGSYYWTFSDPITGLNGRQINPLRLDDVMLSINIGGASAAIEFINYNTTLPSIKPTTFFKEPVKQKMKYLLQTFEILNICDYIQKSCLEDQLGCWIEHDEIMWCNRPN